jgi:hypothetical protein
MIAEVTNFVFEDWVLHRKTFPTSTCTCIEKTYRENVDEIAKHFNF